MLRSFLFLSCFLLHASLEHFLYNFNPSSGCPSSTNSVLNIILSIPVPTGTSGIQIQQVAYVIRSNSFTQPSTMTITGNGVSASVNPRSQAQMCCGATSCDLATYAVNWYNSPCGNPLCSVSTQWYKLSFANTQIGTCLSCGIQGTGSINLNVEFNDAVLEVGNYGAGTTFYVSYIGITPTTSNTATSTRSVSFSLTPSPSSSFSPTSSVSDTSNVSMSFSSSLSPTPSVSLSPSTTVSPTTSRSLSPSMTPTSSTSPSGICYSIQNQLFGTFESVQGDALYFITHGASIYHSYNAIKNVTVGLFMSCASHYSDCVCTYRANDPTGGCSGRLAVITYSYGNQTRTDFTLQNPSCTYYFRSTLSILSPSRTASPSDSTSTSITPSVSVTVTPTQSQSQSKSISFSTTPSISTSQMPSESSLFFTSRYATQTPTAYVTPNQTPCQTPSSTTTALFLKTAYPSINHVSPTASSTSKFMAIRFPSASTTPHIFEATDAPSETMIGKASIGASGVAVGGVLVYAISQIVQRFKKPSIPRQTTDTDIDTNTDTNTDIKEKRIKDVLDKAKKLLEENESYIQIIVKKDDLVEIQGLLTASRKYYQTV